MKEYEKFLSHLSSLDVEYLVSKNDMEEIVDVEKLHSEITKLTNDLYGRELKSSPIDLNKIEACAEYPISEINNLIEGKLPVPVKPTKKQIREDKKSWK